MKSHLSNFLKVLELLYPSDKNFYNFYNDDELIIIDLNTEKLLIKFKFFIKETNNTKSINCILNDNIKTLYVETLKRNILIWLSDESINKWILKNKN